MELKKCKIKVLASWLLLKLLGEDLFWTLPALGGPSVLGLWLYHFSLYLHLHMVMQISLQDKSLEVEMKDPC